MADSVRKQIRDAAQAALVAGGAFGNNVFIGKHDAVDEGDLPACHVYFGASEYELISISANGVSGTRRYRVRRELICLPLAKGSLADIVEEEMDELVEAVLSALLADHTLGGVCIDLNPEADAPEVDDEGQSIHGATAVGFVVETDEIR